jgi:hypothetical protein
VGRIGLVALLGRDSSGNFAIRAVEDTGLRQRVGGQEQGQHDGETCHQCRSCARYVA